MQLFDPHFPDRQWLHYHPLVCVRVCCVCVCVCVWVYVCVNRGFGVDGGGEKGEHLKICCTQSICIYVCTYIYIYTYLHKCIYIYMCVYTHPHPSTHPLTHPYIHKCIYIYMCVYTHTHPSSHPLTNPRINHPIHSAIHPLTNPSPQLLTQPATNTYTTLTYTVWQHYSYGLAPREWPIDMSPMYRSLLQNNVSFIGLFCKRDRWFINHHQWVVSNMWHRVISMSMTMEHVTAESMIRHLHVTCTWRTIGIRYASLTWLIHE